MKQQNLRICILQSLGLCLALNAAHAAVPADTAHKTPITTGTRLHSDRSQPMLISYSREDILKSGAQSTADFLRNLPINAFGSQRPISEFGSLRPINGTAAPGDNYLSLRGLGASRTLILLDGRRLPASPASANATNLNIIPLAAIERIDVMAQGASAIYGSDAIGGVVNIITRNAFQGAELMLQAAQPSLPRRGGESASGSVLFGAQSAQSHVVASVTWDEKEAVFDRDLPWRESFSSIYGNSFTTITYGFDDFNWTSYRTACESLGDGYFTTANTLSLNGTRCAYDFTADETEDTAIDNKALLVNASHAFNQRWLLTARTLFSQTESFGNYAPVPGTSYFSSPLSANSPNNPTNPNSPLFDPSLGLSPQAVNWWHRFASLGTRDFAIKTQLLDAGLNLSGQIGPAQLQFGIRHTNNNLTDVRKNNLAPLTTQTLIENGTFSLADPFAASETTLNAMRYTAYRKAKYDQDQLFAQLTFDVFELHGGMVQLLAGAEYLQEKYQDLPDPQTQAEQGAGLFANQAFAIRDTQSLFVEAQLPFTQQLSLNAAMRYDDYSDLGDDTASQLSLLYQPIDQLLLGLTYSDSHQAADLKIMNQFDSTLSTSIRENPAWCLAFPDSCITTVIQTNRANPSLDSEQSDQLSLSINYNPIHWLEVSADLWQIRLRDQLRFFGAQELINNAFSGIPNPTDLGCTRDITGALIECLVGYGNGGSIDLSGVDVGVELSYPLFSGQTKNQLMVSHTHEFDSVDNNSDDLIGTPGYPKHRATLYNTFEQNNWSLSYNINLIGPQQSDTSPNRPAPTWVTHDVQFSYHTPWQGQLTLGAKNIGEKSPPLGAGRRISHEYDYFLYNAYGRTVYARYTQTF